MNPTAGSTWLEGRGYTFDEVKEYCESLGGGYQIPVPQNEHQNWALVELQHKISNNLKRDFFLGISKYKDGVYQKGRVMYNQYTQEAVLPPIYSSWYSPVNENYEQHADDYPDHEIYRYAVFRSMFSTG